MLELLIALTIISIFTTISTLSIQFKNIDYYQFPYKYVYSQSQSLKTCERTDLEDASVASKVYFSKLGNVNHAQTVYFNTFNNAKEIVIELGFGRLVFK